MTDYPDKNSIFFVQIYLMRLLLGDRSKLYGKLHFMRASGDKKEKLPTKNDEESSLVAESDEISNLKLVDDIIKILELLDV